MKALRSLRYARRWLMLILLPVPAAAQFADITESVGIDAPMPGSDFQQTFGYFAGGIGIGDFSGNGCPDAFLVGAGESNRLFFNQGNGQFGEDPAIADDIVLDNRDCTAIAVADYNNNGWPDAYLACRPGPGLDGNDVLLINLEGNGFEAVLPEGMHFTDGWSQAAAWGDLTGNGHLDLVVGVHPPNQAVDPNDRRHHDKIFINQGDGTFVDIAEHIDIDPLLGMTLAAKIADINGNGRPDIYLVNDRHLGNVLLINEGPGCEGWCLTNVSEETGADRPADGMGIAIADFDRDGDWDLFYTSTSEGQVLLRNKLAQTGELEFEEFTAPAGIHLPRVGWGTIFFDTNNNGWQDLYVAVSPLSLNDPSDLKDGMFVNIGGSFLDAGQSSGLALPLRSEAAAWLDYNRNGRGELLIGHLEDQYRIYRNDSATSNNWIGFEVRGRLDINRDAIGTSIIVETPDQARQMRERRAGASRSATHDSVLHFGLAQHDSASVTVRWPNGLTQNLGTLAAGHYYVLEYPGSETVFADRFVAKTPLETLHSCGESGPD